MIRSTTGMAVLVLCAATLAGCGSTAQQPVPEPAASQQSDSESVESQLPMPESDVGVLDQAPYRVDIPAEWNGELVMLLHGYEPVGVPRVDPMPPNEATPVFLADGYAVAQSAYATQGWAVADAFADTERLRAHFWQRHGRPQRTYLVGFSLGGQVAVSSLERHAAHYDGALALCSPPVSSTQVFKDALTSLLAFDYFFPAASGIPAGGLTDPAAASLGQMDVMQAVEAALLTNEAKAGVLAEQLQLVRPALAGVISLHHLVLSEMRVRAGGMPLDNRSVVYSGWGDDAAFNAGVKRFAADPQAAQYLSTLPAPSGRLERPLVLQSNVFDPTIPARYVVQYQQQARASGGGVEPLLLPAVGEGHCAFAPEQIAAAFGVLTQWSRTGSRPTGS